MHDWKYLCAVYTHIHTHWPCSQLATFSQFDRVFFAFALTLSGLYEPRLDAISKDTVYSGERRSHIAIKVYIYKYIICVISWLYCIRAMYDANLLHTKFTESQQSRRGCNTKYPNNNFNPIPISKQTTQPLCGKTSYNNVIWEMTPILECTCDLCPFFLENPIATTNATHTHTYSQYVCGLGTHTKSASYIPYSRRSTVLNVIYRRSSASWTFRSPLSSTHKHTLLHFPHEIQLNRLPGMFIQSNADHLSTRFDAKMEQQQRGNDEPNRTIVPIRLLNFPP